MHAFHVALLAASLGVATVSMAANLESAERTGAADAGGASVLLAIDQNRATIVERIVNDWGDRLIATGAGVSREQLKAMLSAMRADQLLAASLAGSLDGLKTILASSTAANGKSRIAAAGDPVPNALGSTTSDLVYTPVTPCRLFDTRTGQGGKGAPTPGNPFANPPVDGEQRVYGAVTPVPQQGGPGNCSVPAGAAVVLMVVGTLTPTAPGFIQAGPQGATSLPNALVLYQPNDQYGASLAIPLNAANGQFVLVEQGGQADLYGDLLGYFAPPLVTQLDCSGVQNFATIAKGGTTLDVTASCTTGYTATGGGCLYFNLDGSTPSLPQNGVILNRSAQVRDSTTGALLNQWTCRGTNNDATTDFRLASRIQCCRIPGR